MPLVRRAERAPVNLGLRGNAALHGPVGRSLLRRPNFTPRRQARAKPIFRRAARAPENMGLRGNTALPPWAGRAPGGLRGVGEQRRMNPGERLRM